MEEKKENVEVKTEVKQENKTSGKKKIITFSIIGGVAIILIIAAMIIFLNIIGKPSKKKSEELVKDFLSTINDKDEDDFLKLIDTKGYIVFSQEDEKKFDVKYKKLNTYIKNYLDDKNYDDISDAEDAIAKTFKNKYNYSSTEYSLKEITEVKKSSKSKKIVIIKAKVKAKTSYSTDTKALKLYVMKIDGKYKIVGTELE